MSVCCCGRGQLHACLQICSAPWQQAAGRGGEFCCVLTVGRPLPLLACLCSGEPLRALARTDFEKVLEQFTPPSRAAQAARARLGNGTAAAGTNGSSSSGVDGDSMQLVAAALRAMLMGAADGAAEA